jgi:iron complex outermembrane recepter protein
MPSFSMKYLRGLALGFVVVATVLAIVCGASVAQAQSKPPGATLEVDLPAQPMDAALRQLADKHKLQVVFSPNDMRGLMAPEVKGRYTVEQVLQRLTAGTPLTYAFNGNDTVVVRGKGSETGALGGASSSGPIAAQATTSSTSRPDVVRGEGIVVTAQKREERLIDVPISIVALDAEDLRKRNITNIDDLPAAVPGMAVVGSGGFQRRIMLRGVSNTFGNTLGSASLIGVYLDEAALTPNGPASEFDLRTYDLERIEVLRGPQGTLYGANSVGGTIRFITANPLLNRFAAKADVAASFIKDGEPGQRVDAMLNVPLVNDQFAVRIAGTFDRAGGWVDQPAAGKKDINGQEVAHVRTKALWRPSPDLDINLMAVVHRNDGGLGGRSEDAAGNFTQLFDLTTSPSSQDDYDIYNATITYDLERVRLLSSSSYLKVKKDIRDFGSEPQLSAPPAPRLRAYTYLHTTDVEVFTQEVRLMSEGPAPLQWTVGGFYRDAKADLFQAITQDGLFPTPINIANRSHTKSWASFGDASYQLTEKFKVGAGLRYSEEGHKAQSGIVVGSPATLGPQRSTNFHSLAPRVYGQYKWQRDVSIYASAAKGFRSGGFGTVGAPDFEPETVWSYELGSKASLANGKLSTEAALFYSDYKDYQVQGVITGPTGGLLTTTSNGGDARIKGVELGLAWHATDAFQLGFNGTYMKSEFHKINVAAASYAVGDRLDLVPNYSYGAWAEYRWMWRERPGFFRLDYSEQGRSVFRNRRIGPQYFGQSDVISRLDANIGLQWNDHLSISFLGENLLNDRGLANPFGQSDNIATRPRPRTYWIRLGINFS